MEAFPDSTTPPSGLAIAAVIMQKVVTSTTLFFAITPKKRNIILFFILFWRPTFFISPLPIDPRQKACRNNELSYISLVQIWGLCGDGKLGEIPL